MASAERRLRVVLVGCGDIAQTEHLPALARSDGAELAGVVDVSPGTRDRLAADYGVPAAASLDEALGWRPDAAIVATPPEVTPDLTRRAVRAGLHVLCEKPMALDVATARAVHEEVSGTDRVVQVGFVNRFSPVIARVREWITDGRLGGPLVFTLSTYDERYDPQDTIHTRRIMHFLEHGPAFLHEAAHQTDYVFHLGGGVPIDVVARGVTTSPEFPSENYTAALVRYDNGNLARLEVTWMLAALPPNVFRVMGPLGTVQVDRAHGRASLTGRDAEERFEMDEPWVRASFDRQLASFVAAARTGRRTGPGTVDGVVSLALCRQVVDALADARR